MEGKAGKIVMFLLLEKLVTECDTGSHELCDTALYDLLRKLRILKLVTYGHLITCPHEPWKICFKRMMWKTGHRNGIRSRIGSFGQNDPQNLTGSKRVLTICFVKIAAPEEKQSLGMLRLHSKELLHHRGLGRFFLCHKSVVNQFGTRSGKHPPAQLRQNLPRASTYPAKLPIILRMAYNSGGFFLFYHQ